MDTPLWARFAMATAWSVAYGLIAWFGIWRPNDPTVSVVIVAAIYAGHLPPRSIRPFVSGAAFLIVAAVLWLMVNSILLAVISGVYGVISIVQGLTTRAPSARSDNLTQ